MEFAIISPLLLIFAIQMFDLGNMLYHYSVLTQLAREGARFGGQSNQPDMALQAQVQTHLNQIYTTGGWGNRLRFIAPPAATAVVAGNDLHVAVQANYAGFLPPWQNFALRTECVGPRL